MALAVLGNCQSLGGLAAREAQPGLGEAPTALRPKRAEIELMLSRKAASCCSAMARERKNSLRSSVVEAFGMQERLTLRNTDSRFICSSLLPSLATSCHDMT